MIKFLHASKGHEFMVDCVWSGDQAQKTHEVFKEGEEEGQEDAKSEEGSQAGDEAPKDIIETFKHSFVPEVVREPLMHFEKVPRLGCYMAIPLAYNSCLFNEALEESIEDFNNVKAQREEQDKAKLEWEEKQAAKQEGDQSDEQVPEWPEIGYAPFKTFKEEYVVCLDTLG